MSRMKSVMTPQQMFSQVEKPKIQRSTFDRSHGYKTTMDAGLLIPFYLDEAVPGDTFKMKSTIFGRLATPLKPIMDNIAVDVHFFSVPNRLVWTNFVKMMGEQENPDDTTDYIEPVMTPDDLASGVGYAESSLFDYMGLPTKVQNYSHRSAWLRAYNLIWNEWYRDENLQDSVPVNKGDSNDDPDIYAVLPRGKRKDYFTSCLPFAQKATPVTIPIGDSAPLNGSVVLAPDTSSNNVKFVSHVTQMPYGTGGTLKTSGTTGDVSDTFNNSPGVFDPNGAYVLDGIADLSQATAQTINQLREAFQIQRMFERDARGGTRYIEQNLAHFGVRSADARLQRPEYLGGGTSYVNINPIAQQSATSGDGTPQGNLAAMGTFSINSRGFTKSFTEHELIIGLISVRADLTYQQGLNRMWSRSTRFDHYFPSLAHLGEQAVLNKEIYMSGITETDEAVFGYNERYAEMRYKPSQITGLFRSNASASLDVWHLSQDFGSTPALDASFIEENPPIDRVIAVPSEPHFIMDVWNELHTTRPMPTYGTPGLIDHF